MGGEKRIHCFEVLKLCYASLERSLFNYGGPISVLNYVMKTGIAIAVLLVGFQSNYSQTVADIEERFGKRQDVYSVSEHIWMTPEYGTDGQVCRMRVYTKPIAGNTNYLGSTLDFKELRDVLNSLVPLEKRGFKKKLNFGTTATGGPSAWTTYPYEEVTFIFSASFLPSKFTDSPPLIRGEYKFPLRVTDPSPKEEISTPSEDDFLPSESLEIQIVTIKWNHRTCSN